MYFQNKSDSKIQTLCPHFSETTFASIRLFCIHKSKRKKSVMLRIVLMMKFNQTQHLNTDY